MGVLDTLLSAQVQGVWAFCAAKVSCAAGNAKRRAAEISLGLVGLKANGEVCYEVYPQVI